MGDAHLDDLARALAKPMPRRAALRMLAAGLAAATVPGLTARRARAADPPPPCSGGGTFCGNVNPLGHKGYNIGCCLGANDNGLTVCCPGEPGVYGSWCCQTGFTCGAGTNDSNEPNCKCNGRVNPRTGECNCPWTKVCGNTCCDDHEKCEDGECVACDSEERCGKECCANGLACKDKSKSLCCVKTWNLCHGSSKCCPPLDTCCRNPKTGAVKCCGPGVECEKGICKCTKDEKKCGNDCCKKHEECSKGLCCAKDLVNCDGKCCKPHLCVPSAGKKVCCPIGRIATPNGRPVCCPPGTVPDGGDSCCSPGNPNCCDGELTPLCAKGRICTNGKCH